MNDTTGEFNYTGLVENMKWKAGMFYGRIFSTVWERKDADCRLQLDILCLGTGSRPMSRRPRIILCRTRPLESQPLFRRNVRYSLSCHRIFIDSYEQQFTVSWLKMPQSITRLLDTDAPSIERYDTFSGCKTKI